MKLETFFEKFDQFADAPDAVAKMRELILLLALDGKIGDTDAATWERVQLGDLGEWGSGGTPLSTESRYYDGNIPWLIIGDLNDGVVTSSMKTITEEGLANSSARMLPKNVLLIAMYGSIGKLGITGIECATNQAIAFCKPYPDRADLRYLFYAFMGLRPKFLSRGQGLAQKNISQRILRAWEIGLPPLAEQKRIVEKVDELMALCDRLEAQQQERETRHAALARASLARFADAPTPANLPFLFHPSYAIPPADLRKSILTLAVQGKLVPQDPNDEPAARVLERIDAAPKRAMRTRATEEDEGGEPTELEPLFELPPGWEWAPFRRLPLQASVGIDRGRSMQGPDKAVGYFKMNNIRNSGGVDLSDLTRIDATPDEIEAFALADGDFLFNTRNSRELVGKTCVFRAPSDDPILYNNNILRVKFIEGFSPDFLDYWFRSPEGSAELEKLKSNTTNVCAIYQGKLSGFPCAVPPLAEQRRIVAKVEQLMALVYALETQLAASRATSANLLSALVAELTGTPNDGKVSIPSTSTTGRRGRPRKL
jgi:type I restriction enzyme S subunit